MGEHSAPSPRSDRIVVIVAVIVLAVGAAVAVTASYLSTQATADPADAAVGPGHLPEQTASPASRPSAVAAPQRLMKAQLLQPAPVYTFPIAGCETTYANAHHDYPAADMFAARGCTFVAPISGVVDEIETEDSWDSATNIGAARGGRSVSIVGDDGVRYYGSHLEAVADGIRPGVRVASGDVLGYIGDSGSAAGTGTHLHFALSWPTPPGHWWVRRGTLPPASILDDWRAGQQTSPVQAVEAARRAYGDGSECHVYC